MEPLPPPTPLPTRAQLGPCFLMEVSDSQRGLYCFRWMYPIFSDCSVTMPFCSEFVSIEDCDPAVPVSSIQYFISCTAQRPVMVMVICRLLLLRLWRLWDFTPYRLTRQATPASRVMAEDTRFLCQRQEASWLTWMRQLSLQRKR